MDFFHQSDGSQTDSDISDNEEEISGEYQSEHCEEDIILRDGLQKCLLLWKNKWTFILFQNVGNTLIITIQ